MTKGTVLAVVGFMALVWLIALGRLYADQTPSPDACFIVEALEATIIRARDRGVAEDNALAVMQKENAEDAERCRKYGNGVSRECVPGAAEDKMEIVRYIYKRRLTIPKMLGEFEGAGCPKLSPSVFESYPNDAPSRLP